MKKINILAGVCVVLLLLTSCNRLKESIQQTFEPRVDTTIATFDNDREEERILTKKPKAIAEDSVLLRQAQQALINLDEFSGKPVFLHRSVHFYSDGRILTEIQNPHKPEEIDKFGYKDGRWEKGDPVMVTKTTNSERHVYALTEFDFVTAHKIYQTISSKMHEINSPERQPTVYAVFRDGDIRWYPTTLKTERNRYSISFDTDGNMLSFEQE